jgi:hypothetical protein
MTDDPRKEICLCVCWAVGAKTNRSIDAGLIRGMVEGRAGRACRSRGTTPGGVSRWERDVINYLRKLEKCGVLQRTVNRGEWMVVRDIESKTHDVARQIY